MAKKINNKQFSIYLPNKITKLSEAIKSEVEQIAVKFPKELGEEHPFNFKDCEDICKKNGLANAGVDRHLDFIISPGFSVNSKDKKAKDLINNFIEESNFYDTIRPWIKEALMKGNGFMEISIDPKTKVKPAGINLRIINANNMYIKRNKNGEILNYYQYTGNFNNKFDFERYLNNKKIIEFTQDEVAHLPINEFGDCPYGYGILYPALKSLDNLASGVKDQHMLMKRKANAPIHAKLGNEEEPATQADVDGMGAKLEYLNNYQEWSTDHKVDLKVIDFGPLGDKFNGMIDQDKEEYFMSIQLPAVQMGSGYQNEGIAGVQSDGTDRRVKALQARIERVIEDKIFKVILRLNGLDSSVDIEWGLPSHDTLNKRLNALTLILQNPMLSAQLRAMLEKDIATTLLYDEGEIELLPTPEEAIAMEKKREMQLQQPEIPGAKPNAKESAHNHLIEYYDESDNILKLNEWVNFDYIQYKEQVLKAIKNDNFTKLAAKNSQDIALGLLNDKQIEQVRKILLKNFENNGTLNDIANDLKSVGIKDRFVIDEVTGRRRLQLDKDTRRIMIARTESTRLANEGLLNNYKINGSKKVRFLASISDRTCPICEDDNGRIYDIDEASGVIPVHVACRCTWMTITEQDEGN